MAPNFKGKTSFKGKNPQRDYSKGPQAAAVKKKRKWIPVNKFFSGSVQEGQGFAFNRKQKAQRQYSKLLRKERWRMQNSKPQLKDNYPEHLKHLYMAEQERLDEEEQVKRHHRKKRRAADAEEDKGEDMEAASVNSSSVTGTADSAEQSAASVLSNELPQRSQSESSSHKGSQRQWKQKKMSSYQKSKQDYEKLKEERERKREEYLKDKEEREEALKKYREKKNETYQLLKKKTKKGQPNLNLQMELLLQKIQSQRK
ncbi:thyroid transcription factor 1-associated protein 26 homolog isoform X1 [Salminus brasiliensis]|uniref:thyroid transcription factor 1-associated protein 26 homolog isoform X1 n=1 Tax=Salminus brasiliensis TaxID=930266 RepID=UPI003B82CEDA